jgi:hypothetical protein
MNYLRFQSIIYSLVKVQCTLRLVCVCVCLCVCVCVWERERAWVRVYIFNHCRQHFCMFTLKASLLLKQRKLLLQWITWTVSSAELLGKLLWQHHHNHRHHSIIYLMTGQQPLSKLVLYSGTSSALSLNIWYLLSSWKPSSSSSHLFLVVPSLLSFLQLRALEVS